LEFANAHLPFPFPSDVFEVDMPDEKRPTDSVTEGRGAYDKHAKLPAGGAALAMPHLKNAVANLSLDASQRPVVIADYGSSQGKNSNYASPRADAFTRADDYRSQVGLTGAIGANAERPRDN
jgi:hypothetical protein